MWADAPPDWARAADKKSVFPIRAGAPYARMATVPQRMVFPCGRTATPGMPGGASRVEPP